MKTGIRYVCTDILLIIINSISQAMGNGVGGEKGVAEIGHRHDKVVGKPGHVGVAARQEGDNHPQRRENRAIKKQHHQRQEVEGQTGLCGQGQQQDNAAGVQSPQSARKNLPRHKLPQRRRRDDDLVKGLFIEPLHVEILGNGVEAAVHGGQGDHAGDEEVEIGLAVHLGADAPAEDDQIHGRRDHGGQGNPDKVPAELPPLFPQNRDNSHTGRPL